MSTIHKWWLFLAFVFFLRVALLYVRKLDGKGWYYRATEPVHWFWLPELAVIRDEDSHLELEIIFIWLDMILTYGRFRRG